jgi:hypothetical protein
MSASIVHGVLLAGDLGGAIAVALGIWFEKAAATTRRHRWSTGFVLGGVLVESVCALILFLYDESISRAQQDKIIALEQRLLARSLSQTEQHDVSNAVNAFAGQQFRIALYTDDQESIDIALKIESALVSAGWSETQPPEKSAIVGVTAGVVVSVAAAAPESTRDAAKALVSALNAKKIAAVLRQFANQDAPPQPLSIDVGIKP